MIRAFVLSLVVIFICCGHINAQKPVVIRGAVYSYSENIRIPKISIVWRGTTIGTQTNSDGEFSLHIDAIDEYGQPKYGSNPVEIMFTSLGYSNYTYKCVGLRQGDTLTLAIFLDKKSAFRNRSYAKKIETPPIRNENRVTPVLTSSVSKSRYAFIVGNSGYLEGRGLEGRPLNDARDIAERLQSLGFTVTRHEDLADKQSFEKAFQQFNRTAKGADAALFFYAGHGIEVAGENYMIPTGAKLEQKEDVRYEAFPVSRVLDEFRELGAKNSIVLLDACRENPFRSWSRGEVDRGFKTIDLAQARIDNLFIGYATAPGSVAQNGTGRNGTFTMALLKFLRKGERFDDIFQDTTNEVMNRTGNAQRPFQTSSLRTKLIF
ncbi:caspase family protein [Larkinella punicea]